ncbi:S-adenosyl-L-methionine-dependent methyltransferase [Xylariaceae sp. FL0594]|nr:S-adenosyl-L-methionine-dependent methyltransferase [Xylariaceae sp. FL0594]
MSGQGYPLPVPGSSGETQRLGVQHELSVLDMNGDLFLSPLFYGQKQRREDEAQHNEREPAVRAVDIGTGTGVWACEVGKRYPSMHVIGLDLAVPTSLPSIPPNVRFAIQDVQAPWVPSVQSAGPFDFIYGRQVLINLPDPRAALRQAWENLRPGGFIEFREFRNPFISEKSDQDDDDAVPFIVQWHRGTVEAAAKFGCDHRYAEKLPDELARQGFVDIHVVDHKIPVGGWAPQSGDRAEKGEMERMRQLDMLSRELIRLSVPGLTNKMFIEGLGWSKERAQTYADKVLAELSRQDLSADRISLRFRMVWARKPVESSTTHGNGILQGG